MAPSKRGLLFSGGGEARLELRVSAWRREGRAQLLLRGGAAWCALAALGAAFLFGADFFLSLPLAARWAGWFAALGAAGWGAWGLLLGPWSRLDEKAVLRAAAGRWPELAAYLLPAWELSRGLHPPGLSPELIQAHLEQTRERLARAAGPLYPATLDQRGWSGLAGLAILAAVLIPLSLAYPALWPRVLSPWRDAPLERLLAVRPGDARLPWGASSRIEAEWKEPLAQTPRLELRGPAGPWRAQNWDEEGGGIFSFRLAGLVEPLDYRVRWRDSLSRTYRLTPAPYPHFTAVHLRLTPPAYARRPPREFGAAQDLQALAGSRVDVEGTPDRTLDEAWLVLSRPGASARLRFKPNGGGVLRASFFVRSDAAFGWELKSEGQSDPRPPRYAVRLLKDEPPSIELLSPAFETEASPREGLPIEFEAEDDIGLASIELRYAVLQTGGKGAERVLPVKTFDPRPAHDLGEFRWDLSGLAPGDRVEFYLRALDGRPSGPAGTSRKMRLKVVDFEGGHRPVQEGRTGADLDARRELERLWGEVIEAQSRIASAAESLQQDRLQALLAAQRALLKSLAPEESALAARARKLGLAEPAARMEAARDEFEAGRIETSLGGLKQAAARLEDLSRSRPRDAELSGLAKGQADLLARLAAGSAPPAGTGALLARSLGAARAQRENMRGAAGLGEKSQALAEMESAAEAFDRADIPSASASASKALEDLERGRREAEGAGLSGPAGGVRPGSTAFVPLPKGKEEDSLRRLRREILQSLQERYPKAYKGVIENYLKRLSE